MPWEVTLLGVQGRDGVSAPARPAYFCFFDFGPLFNVPLNFRNLSTSASVNRQRVLLSIGVPIDGRIFPEPIQRSSVTG